jgi:hypothetical protein
VAAAAGSLAACDKLPLLAPNLSTITVSSSSAIVQANGTAEIRATVLESSGTPVQNGTTVTFTTNLGALSPPEARTINGVATVQFVANGQSGEADIRATSGAAKPADAANPGVRIKVGGAATGRLQVAASPSSVPTSGGSAVINATVLDINGNPLGGVAVGFTTTAGTLSSPFAVSNSSGVAQVVLTTNRDATVTATAGASGTSGAITGTVQVTVSSLPTLSLTVTTATPTEDQATAFSLVVGAAAQDSFQSVTIDFGDGTARNLGALAPGTTTSVSNVYDSDGTFTVTATGVGNSGGTQRATAIVTVNPRAGVVVAITTNEPADGSAPTTVLFRFTASVTPTTAIISHYNWNFGDGTGANGVGPQTSHKYNVPGSYTVTATAVASDGNSGIGRTEVIVE